MTGVLPILYTAIGTLYTQWRVRHSLLNYDIESPVYSRLMSGTLDIELPVYELIVLPRGDPKYWEQRQSNIARSAQGASWHGMNWSARPIDSEALRLHFSEALVLPKARAMFRELVNYLGDLGCTTNPDGFWELHQRGLNVTPGTCLIQEVDEEGQDVPILVIAIPTIKQAGSLILRFQHLPSQTSRNSAQLKPSYVQLRSTIYSDQEGCSESREEIHHLEISVKGITEMISPPATPAPVYGVAFWFTYCVLASSIKNGHLAYSGRPAGFKMRLKTLYFSRECALPIIGPSTHMGWSKFLIENLSQDRIQSIPVPWTLDSSARTDRKLSVHFKLAIEDRLRKRSANFRKVRAQAIERVLIASPHCGSEEAATSYMPVEAFGCHGPSWAAVAPYASPDLVALLHSQHLPTSQEICLAACNNQKLAEGVASFLLEVYSWFIGKMELSALQVEPTADSKVIFICAMIVLDSIAQNAGYLASLCDIEQCLSTWKTVFLS
jgi:hypothetical protein